MNYEERLIFLSKIREEVQKDETLFSEIINCCQSGINAKIQQLREQACDMEAIAVAFSTTSGEKYKQANQDWIKGLLISKIKKHNGTDAFFAWTDTLNKLEGNK